MVILRGNSHYPGDMFNSCLSLPKTPREARLVAEALESLARALREWPADAWRRPGGAPAAKGSGPDSLFERLVARARPLALDRRQREEAIRSAEAVAAVLRVLWPECRAGQATWLAIGEEAPPREPTLVSR
jgi:hypothetical protein